MKKEASAAKLYITGYVLSVILTLIPFGLLQVHYDTYHVFPTHPVLMVVFIITAILQLFVQAVFFLGLRDESGPRWNLTVLCFTLLIIFIFVGGTLWIMNNLQHAMTPFDNGIITPQTEQD